MSTVNLPPSYGVSLGPAEGRAIRFVTKVSVRRSARGIVRIGYDRVRRRITCDGSLERGEVVVDEPHANPAGRIGRDLLDLLGNPRQVHGQTRARAEADPGCDRARVCEMVLQSPGSRSPSLRRSRCLLLAVSQQGRPPPSAGTRVRLCAWFSGLERREPTFFHSTRNNRPPLCSQPSSCDRGGGTGARDASNRIG